MTTHEAQPADHTEPRGAAFGRWSWEVWDEDGRTIRQGTASNREQCERIVCDPAYPRRAGTFWQGEPRRKEDEDDEC